MPHRNNITVTMPPGDYILGDPIYNVTEALREHYCSEAYRHDNSPFTVNGKECLIFQTAHGDGCLSGSDGFDYPVDSAAIGLLPVELTHPDQVSHLVKRVAFDNSFDCTADYDRAILQFGNIVIDVG